MRTSINTENVWQIMELKLCFLEEAKMSVQIMIDIILIINTCSMLITLLITCPLALSTLDFLCDVEFQFTVTHSY